MRTFDKFMVLVFSVFAVLFALAIAAHAASLPFIQGDVCNNPVVVKNSVAINVGSATTAELVPAVAGQRVIVCNFVATATGTTPTLQFKTGTKVTNPCDTSPVNLSGVFAPTSGSLIFTGWGGDVFISSLGGEICLTAGGTTPSIQGILTYIQQ